MCEAQKVIYFYNKRTVGEDSSKESSKANELKSLK